MGHPDPDPAAPTADGEVLILDNTKALITVVKAEPGMCCDECNEEPTRRALLKIDFTQCYSVPWFYALERHEKRPQRIMYGWAGMGTEIWLQSRSIRYCCRACLWQSDYQGPHGTGIKVEWQLIDQQRGCSACLRLCDRGGVSFRYRDVARGKVRLEDFGNMPNYVREWMDERKVFGRELGIGTEIERLICDACIDKGFNAFDDLDFCGFTL